MPQQKKNAVSTQPASKVAYTKMAVKNAVKEGAKQVARGLAIDAARFIVGRLMNDIKWYTQFKPITPAVNKERNMGAAFNTTITDIVGNGNTCKYMDVNVSWEDFSDSDAFKQATIIAYQKIRETLKSNLPYSIDLVREYFLDSITIAFIAYQMYRELVIANSSSQTYPDLALVMSSYAFGGTYGLTKLNNRFYGLNTATQESTVTNVKLAEEISDYNKAVSMLNAFVRLPKNLKDFIQHYASTIFVNENDKYDMQLYKFNFYRVPIYDYDDEGKLTIQMVNPVTTSAATLATMIDVMSAKYAIVVADMDKAGLDCVGLNLTEFNENSNIPIAHSPDANQAIINAYTSESMLTENGFIRLDEYSGASDYLTQFLFLGGLANDTLNTRGWTPLLRVDSMVLKYRNYPNLKWPASLTQGAFEVSTDDDYINLDWPVLGVVASTDIDSDIYMSVIGPAANEGASTSGGFITNGQRINFVSPRTTGVSIDVRTVVSDNEWTEPIRNAREERGNWGLADTSLYPVGGDKYLAVCIPGERLTVTMFGADVEANNISQTTTNYVVYFSRFQWQHYANAGWRLLHNGGNTGESFPLGKMGVMTGTNARWWDELMAKNGYERDGYAGAIAIDYDELVSHCDAVYDSTTIQFQSTLVSAPTTARVYSNSAYKANTIQLVMPNDMSEFTGLQIFWALDYSSSFAANYSFVNFEFLNYDMTGSIGEITSRVTAGYLSLASWITEQSDIHVPIRARYRIHTSDRAASVILDNSILLKESYKPYWYNIYDLTSVGYDMFYSLFAVSSNRKRYGFGQKEDYKRK